MEYLNQLEPWHWLAFGAVMIILEVFVPSAIFLWPGIAAIVVGLVAFVAPDLSWMVTLTLWAVLSVIFATGWQLFRKKHKGNAPVSTINRRGEQYVGRHFTLTKDIVNGSGELHVDDTRWKIMCDHDLPAGVKVKVVSVDGTSLRVAEFVS